MLRIAVLLGMALVPGVHRAAAGWQAWSSVERAGSYSLGGGVAGNEDISGIAFLDGTHGLLGTDEERLVYTVELSREQERLEVTGNVPLLPGGDEIDIEAIAADGEYYYVTGSHGVAKKSGEYQHNRFRIFRIGAEPETGLPKVPHDVSGGSLSTLLVTDPVLGPYFRKPLQQHGINVEGLAARNGRLYVGLRNPNLEGDALVIEFGAADLFDRATVTDYRLHRLPLGPGLGIRALAWAADCMLLIAGNAGSEPSGTFTSTVDYVEDRGFELFCWDGESTQVRRIGTLPETPGKAEAMAVLGETDTGIDILVFFDGPKNGKPTVYRVR